MFGVAGVPVPINRATALQAAMTALARCDVVVNTLVWEAGYAHDGLSDMSRLIDTTFASTGFVTVDFNALSDGAESLVLQSDGRIVLGGFATPTSNDGYGLARINP